jgi:hypothetical protein
MASASSLALVFSISHTLSGNTLHHLRPWLQHPHLSTISKKMQAGALVWCHLFPGDISRVLAAQTRQICVVMFNTPTKPSFYF